MKKVEAERQLEGKATSNPTSENGSNSGNMDWLCMTLMCSVQCDVDMCVDRSVFHKQVIVKKSYGKNMLSVSLANIYIQI